MTNKPFYITTSIPYLNGAPHVGHALEFVQADFLARYMAFTGKEVRLHTGTDENGSKMYETAAEQGITTQELADKNAKLFEIILEKLNIDYHSFIRTSDPKHHKGAQAMWQKLEEKGDIYKKQYEGKYCVGCETFMHDKDLVDGDCPIHKKTPVLLKEENYFFALSKYTEQIKEKINSCEFKIQPESRRNEIISLVNEGLQDISFSRPKKVLPWGVTTPNDPDHVMYVWCDALSNYVTALGFGSDDADLLEKYWPAEVQLIGKDILRFHAAIWIGMLLSAELPLPKELVVHGFINSGGQKMSKSLGNVIDPAVEIDKYGCDPVRYYLLREIATLGDGDYNNDRFTEIYNSELANNLGNVVSRTSAMLHKYNEGKTVKVNLPKELEEAKGTTINEYHAAVGKYNFKLAIETISRLLGTINQTIDQEKPWQVAKTDPQKAIQDLSNLLELIKTVAILLLPIIPETAKKILTNLKQEVPATFEQSLNNPIAENTEIAKVTPLFPRLEN